MKILVVSSDRTANDHFPINLGDALLTDALAKALSDRGHAPLVADFGDHRHSAGEPRLKLEGLGSLIRAVRDADAVILGGGTLLQDDGSGNGFGGLPRLCATVVGIAKATGTPVAFYAVGCDPVERIAPRALLRFAVQNVPVWVRDAESVERVARGLRGSAKLGADASLLLPGRTSNSVAGPLVLALNRKHAAAVTADIVGVLREIHGSVVFLNMSQGGSEWTDSAVMTSAVRDQFDEVTSMLTWEEAESVIASSSVVVASRMHALYASMLVGRPMIAVSELPKVATFADEFDITRVESIVDIAGIEPRFASSSALAAARMRASRSLDSLLATL